MAFALTDYFSRQTERTRQHLILSQRERANEKGLRRALPPVAGVLGSADAIDRESLRVDGLFPSISDSRVPSRCGK